MSNGENELVQFRLQRAFDTLEEARLMAMNEHWNGCVNRLYYASFYAIMALLTKYGHQSSTHKGAKPCFPGILFLQVKYPVDLAKHFPKCLP